MGTIHGAREAALRHVSQSGNADFNPVLIDSVTKDFDIGWIFYYQSAESIGTGAIQALRDASGLGLRAAKAAVDSCLAGKNVKVLSTSVPVAQDLKQRLEKLG
jgi:ribosomal protein L7/L12